ncbi:FUN14 family-domain-containing protein [Radiomyces spectabilis]|uniref:FUN14 family-domain-containing protein n=1 Tax=Radiomyces spectabilis TaxID=64574 RepID=UPI00221E9F92|nr:FUN14 family-domain-containing protein [Radiomyces spectabilis]KAI8391306.1 FUN14 family-domain-containing protein [Radiomyces spectabilis]
MSPKVAAHQPALDVVKMVTLVTTGSVAGSLLFKEPVQCQAIVTQPQASDASTEAMKAALRHREKVQPEQQETSKKGEVAFGMVLGLGTGYLVKKMMKMALLMLGTAFLFLQYMAYNGYITIHWHRLEGRYTRSFDVDRDGRVTQKDLHSKWRIFMNLLTHKIPFKATFLTGFYLGIRMG